MRTTITKGDREKSKNKEKASRSKVKQGLTTTENFNGDFGSTKS